MRQMLTTFINALLSADADAVCGAGWGQVSDERADRRNGYRHRDLDTRIGTLDPADGQPGAALGITLLSRSQVREMVKDLDGQVAAFRTRPLDAGP